MSTAEILSAEARRSRWAVPLTGVAAVLPLGASIATTSVTRDSPSNLPGGVIFISRHVTELALASAIGAVGLALVAAALVALFDSTVARRPQVPMAFRWMALIGPPVAAAASFAGQAVTGSLAQRFASEDGQTYHQWVQLSGSGGRTALAAIGLLANFVVAAAIVVVALNAMRAGLLPRFVGYVGVFAGVFTAIPIVPVPIVLAFWLGALTALFGGRWPNGVPPAWRTGQAEPWPSMAEQAAAREERSGGRGARDGGGAAGGAATLTPGAESEAQPAGAGAGPARPGQARRKRKKRR